MDVHSGHDFPNPYGLQASDFGYDMDSYRVALRFLSDLVGGTDEPRALELNGANEPMLRNWESSGKFRRVLAKCRAAAALERAALAEREAAAVEAAAVPVQGQRFVPWDELPPQPFRVFRMRPPASFGSA